MGTATTASSGGLARRARRGVRKQLENVFGRDRVKVFAERIPYSRTTFCMLVWQTDVPESGRQQLDESPYTFREGFIEDLRTLDGIETYDDTQHYEEWFDRGQRLVVALEGEQVVCYSWLDFNHAFGLAGLPEYRFVTSPDAAYSYEAWTLKTHRGRGLRRLLFTAELLLARDAGRRWVLGYNYRGKHVDNILRNFGRIGVPIGEVVSEVDVFHWAGMRYVRKIDGPGHEAAWVERLASPRELAPGETGDAG